MAIGAALALALALQLVAIGEQSLSGDEAHHLAAGYQALKYGHNRLNLEHPPLVKLVAALPLLLEEEPLSPPLRVDEALAEAVRIHGRPEALRRAMVRGRLLALAVFGAGFLAACFALGRRFGGRRTGLVLLFMVAFSVDILPNVSSLQTDAAVSLGFLLTLLAAFRWLERPGALAAVSLGLAWGLALAAKFSGLLLGPTVLAALLMGGGASFRWHRRAAAAALVGIGALAALSVTYAVANRDYSSDRGREAIAIYCDNRGTLAVDGRLRPFEERLLALEERHPYAAQWILGLLGVEIQNAIGVYPSFAFGAVTSRGRWWYFPVLLLVKTPLAILAVAAAALAMWLLGRRDPLLIWANERARSTVLVAVTAGVYLGAAVLSTYNLGVRHMMPVLPLIYLPLAVFLTRFRIAAVLLVSVLAAESITLAPLWMSATNTWWLGRHNPTRFAFAAGNLEYRQNFIQLAKYARAHRLRSLRVVYPTLGEEVLHAYVPEATLVAPGASLEEGWYAVSVVVEQHVPAILRASKDELYDFESLRAAAEQWHPVWSRIAAGTDFGYVAGTFHLYHLDRVSDSGGGAGPP